MEPHKIIKITFVGGAICGLTELLGFTITSPHYLQHRPPLLMTNIMNNRKHLLFYTLYIIISGVCDKLWLIFVTQFSFNFSFSFDNWFCFIRSSRGQSQFGWKNLLLGADGMIVVSSLMNQQENCYFPFYTGYSTKGELWQVHWLW